MALKDQCAREEISSADLFRVLLLKAFIPLRGMGHFSLSALANKFAPLQNAKTPTFVGAIVRGMRLPRPPGSSDLQGGAATNQ
jgi:hypothetical protein